MVKFSYTGIRNISDLHFELQFSSHRQKITQRETEKFMGKKVQTGRRMLKSSIEI